MAIIRTLSVSITGDQLKFERAIKKAKRNLKKLSNGITENAAKLSKWGATAAAAAGAVAASLVRGQFKAIDSTQKFADRIGIAAEALVGLQFANKLAGNETAALNLGLQRMVRRISEAAAGSGEAKDAIIELGLSAQALDRLSPDKQFLAIADAMEGVKTQGKRVRLAMRLFDTEGVALVNTMRGGSKALKEFMEEAIRLGLTFDRVDAGKVEAANDAITRAAAAFSGLFTNITKQLAPFIEAGANAIGDFIAAFNEGLPTMDRIAIAYAGIIGAIVDKLNILEATVLETAAGLEDLNPFAEEVGNTGSTAGAIEKRKRALRLRKSGQAGEAEIRERNLAIKAAEEVKALDAERRRAIEDRRKQRERDRLTEQTKGELAGPLGLLLKPLKGKGEDLLGELVSFAQKQLEVNKAQLEEERSRKEQQLAFNIQGVLQ